MKLVEWEITLKCNYKCTYCTNLDKSIHPVLDKDQIKVFIKTLGEKYPGVEVFVFGGEPFVHPHIEYIIECFNELKVPFVVQTNFSKKSVEVIRTIKHPFKVQISIHPTEVSLLEVEQAFKTPVDIRIIDVMYVGQKSLKYYFRLKSILPNHKNIFLTPVTDFGDGESDSLLKEYNALRDNPLYSKIIQFETVKVGDRYRSDLWIDPSFTPKGKPCMYNDKYFLYGPNLELYNCCYREKHTGMCNHDKCFLM